MCEEQKLWYEKPIDEFDKSIPLQGIINLPKVSQPKRKQTLGKRHPTTITSNLMKDISEEKEIKMNEKDYK